MTRFLRLRGGTIELILLQKCLELGQLSLLRLGQMVEMTGVRVCAGAVGGCTRQIRRRGTLGSCLHEVVLICRFS